MAEATRAEEILNVKKLKLYLDTSVISYLFADDTPDKMADTKKLWADVIAGKFEVYISSIVVDEIERCEEPKRGRMTDEMKRANIQPLRGSEEVNKLALEYVKNGVLKEKSLADCLHIAYAVVHNCDAIVSWNFKHIVNYKTINGVKTVNSTNKYKEIIIVSPTMLIEEEEK